MRILRSFRFRIAFLAALISGSVLALFGVMVWHELSERHRERIDLGIRSIASSHLDLVLAEPKQGGSRAFLTEHARRMQPIVLGRMARLGQDAAVTVVPEPSARTMSGAFAASQPSPRSVRARISRVEMSSVVTVKRVADLSTLIWLFRSSP